MTDDRCMCACHLLDHDGVMRFLVVAWRCIDCGAEPDPMDGEPYGVIRRHLLANGRVVYLETHGIQGDIGSFMAASDRRRLEGPSRESTPYDARPSNHRGGGDEPDERDAHQPEGLEDR